MERLKELRRERVLSLRELEEKVGRLLQHDLADRGRQAGGAPPDHTEAGRGSGGGAQRANSGETLRMAKSRRAGQRHGDGLPAQEQAGQDHQLPRGLRRPGREADATSPANEERRVPEEAREAMADADRGLIFDRREPETRGIPRPLALGHRQGHRAAEDLGAVRVASAESTSSQPSADEAKGAHP